MTRPIAHTAGTCLPCPKCGRALIYGEIGEGHGWLQCQHKLRSHHPARGPKPACAARVFWLCYRRACTVVGVTTAEYERLRGEMDPARVLEELGVLAGAERGEAA